MLHMIELTTCYAGTYHRQKFKHANYWYRYDRYGTMPVIEQTSLIASSPSRLSLSTFNNPVTVSPPVADLSIAADHEREKLVFSWNGPCKSKTTLLFCRCKIRSSLLLMNIQLIENCHCQFHWNGQFSAVKLHHGWSLLLLW